MASGVVGDERECTSACDAAEYRGRLKARLLALPVTPTHGALMTRTLGPRDQLTPGEADVADVVKELDAAAVVCDSPLICSLALLRCAIGELTLQGTPCCTPVFIDASRLSAGESLQFPFMTVAHVDTLVESKDSLLLLIDCVHACDTGTVAAVIELRKRWPDIRTTVSCDRAAGMTLREDGFRVVPVTTASTDGRPSSQSHIRPTEVGIDDEQFTNLAVAAFCSDGNPLCCPVSAPAAAELHRLDKVPAIVAHAKDTLVIRDLDRYGELFGRRLAEAPTWWPRLARLDARHLAQPEVMQALDVAAARASEFGVSGDWLNAQLGVVDRSSTMSMCGSAMIVGALITGLGERSSDVLERYDLLYAVQSMVSERDRLLRDAATNVHLTTVLASVAYGLDRCKDGASVPPRGEFIDGMAEHLVTVREFGRFLADNGYRDQRWWVDFPQFMNRWSEPLAWQKQIPRSTHPVTGVSWYEASAYAAYLSAKEDSRIEIASAADRLRVCGDPFPWGSESPSPYRLNYDQQLGHTSPVGTYRLGLGPAGHADLAGNVWEWCSDTVGDNSAVVCGGGWYTNATYVTSAYNYRFHRENRFDDLGFRLNCRGVCA